MNKTPAMSRLGLAVLGLLLGAGSAPALAQEPGYAYGGLSVGQSRARIDEARISASLLGNGLATTGMARDERDTGFRLFGGYQFNRYFGLEAGYTKLGKFGFDATTSPAGSLAGEISLKSFSLDLVGTLPLSTYWSAIGRVGVQSVKASDRFSGSGAVTVLDPNPSKRSTQPKFGLGLQYEVNRNLLVRGEFERYRVDDAVGNKGDVNLFSVGLVIPFGRAPQATPQRVSMAPAYVPPPAPAPAPAPPPPVVAAPVAPPPPVVVAAPPPAPAPVVPPRRRVSFSADSLFGFDHSEIRPEGRAALDTFVGEMKGTRFEVITVEGHTDRLGAPAYNQALSGRRAETVKAYLVNTGGLDGSKISVVAKGEAEPVSKPEDCKGNKANPQLIACLQADRRVEVEVVGTR